MSQLVLYRRSLNIEVVGLSSKEKALVHDRGRNFDPIIIKLGTYKCWSSKDID